MTTETTQPMTRIVKAGPAAVAAAARCLAAGGLLAFPTETVYGLGADARNGEAVARLYEAKGRPAFNPLICHVEDRVAAARLGRFDADAARLAQALWPGPLTLVVPKRPDCGVAELATAGLPTIALRVPDHPVARAILAEFGQPVVAPSANRSGHVSPTTAAHVLADLHGRVDLIVDGGRTQVGVESTIVACLDRPVLLRPGGLPRAQIERALRRPLAEAAPEGPALEDGVAPMAPGQLASHYAPHAGLRLDADRVLAGEALPFRLRGGAAAGRGHGRAGPQPVEQQHGRPDRGGSQFVLAPARARCTGREHDRSDAGAAAGPRRGHQ